MSNDINTVSYAIEIQTTYEGGTIPEIGMDTSGRLLYITDDIDTSTGFFYDDSGLPVTDVYKRDLFVKGGITPSRQTMKLIEGGDYAYVGDLTCSLSNTNRLFERMLKTNDLYLHGASMTLYIVMDDLFIKRWSGSISETSFGSDTFTFIGKDNHNSDNSTVMETSFGFNNTELTPVVQNEEAIIDKQFIKRLEPNGDFAVQNYDYSPSPSRPDDWIEKYFNGMSAFGEYRLATESKSYNIYMNGHFNDVTVGMFLQFEGFDTLFYIDTVVFDTYETAEDIGTTNYTKLTINNLVDSISDSSNFYGIQPLGMPQSVIDATNVADDEIISISIYRQGLTFPPVEGSEFVKNGDQFVGLDEDGNTILIDGVLNGDGGVTVTSSTITTVTTPTSIKYFSDARDGSTTNLIDAGLMTNMQLKGTDVLTIPNDLRPNGDYFTTEENKYHYFIVEFDEEIDDHTPVVMVTAGVNATENWELHKETTSGTKTPALYKDTYLALDNPTQYYSTSVNTDEKTIKSTFRAFDIEVYKVVSDVERGDVPFNSVSFTLPNTRHSTRVEEDLNVPIDPDSKIWSIDVQSVASTNAPINIIDSDSGVSDFISTNNGLLQWGEAIYTPDGTGMPIPGAKIVDVNPPANVSSSKKLLFRIQVDSTLNGGDDYWTNYDLLPIGTGTERFYTVNIGVNTLAVYKTTEIGASDNITLKTTNSTTNNYGDVIKDLSGAQSTFRSVVGEVDRNDWWVGNQITDEQNTFNIVTTLCQQGFVAGFTDRDGDVVLSEFLQDMKDDTIPFQTHDSGLIIDGSVKSFKLSDISKCWNEFTVKYNKSQGQYLKQIGVYRVDEDVFPLSDDVLYDQGTSVNFRYTYRSKTSLETQLVSADSTDDTGLNDALKNDLYDVYKIEFIDGSLNPVTITFSDPVYDSSIGDADFYTFTQISSDYTGSDNSQFGVDTFYISTGGYLWKSYISGAPDYAESKSLWDSAHNSWLINHRIRKAPTNRTDLEWCVDLGEFYGNDNESFFTTYQWEYTKQLVDYSTRQKYQVEYELPLTYDTARLNLMDKILFNFDFGTGNGTVEGRGWLTKIILNSITSRLKVEVTFEQDFMTPEDLIPLDNDIWEQPASVPDIDDIIEDFNNTDNIIEVGQQ